MRKQHQNAHGFSSAEACDYRAHCILPQGQEVCSEKMDLITTIEELQRMSGIDKICDEAPHSTSSLLTLCSSSGRLLRPIHLDHHNCSVYRLPSQPQQASWHSYSLNISSQHQLPCCWL